MSRRRSAIAAGLLFLMTVVASPVRAAPPSNDTSAGAIVIDAVPASIPVDLTEATLDGDPQFCGGGSASVWYRYTPTSDAFLTASLADAGTGTLSISVGDPFIFQDCVYPGGSRTFLAAGGTTYWLQVTTDGAGATLGLASSPTLANDRFADAADIQTLPATVTADLTTSTSTGDSGACSFATNGAWYRLTPSDDVTVDIHADADQSAFVTVVGASVDAQLGCHYSWQGPLRIALQGGQTYHLQLSAHSPSSSGTSMSIDALPPAPANDARSAAIAIASMPFSASADLRSAHPDDDDQGQCFGSDWPVVWYRYTPTADAILALAVSGEARAAFFFEGEEGETIAGCTAHMDELNGKVLAKAGTTYDIGLAAPPSIGGAVDLTVTSTPAPTLDVVVDANGSIEKVGGVAVIKGTVTCSTTGPAWIEMTLRQRVGRTTLIEGEGFVSVECRASAVAWTVRVPGQGAPFGSGSVAVDFRGEFGEWPLTVSDRGSVTVKLKGR